MDPIIGGALISAGSSLLGGLFGSSQAEKNAAMQKEFAQKGIRWRVADAKAAGIHPLYALGAQVTPFSPVSVGDGGFAAAGQDLSRAYMATRTEGEKVDLFAKQAQTLALEKAQAEIGLIKAQTARYLTPDNQAPFPGTQYLLSGQTQSGPVAGLGPNGSQEPGSIPDVGHARTSTGHMPVPSDAMKQRIEDNVLQEALWMARNQVLPFLGINRQEPNYSPGKGNEWLWTGVEWRAVPKGSKHRINSAARMFVPGGMLSLY